MTAYYNEIDPYAAQWLRNLIKAGHIAPGYVDERSIVDVKPEDLTEFTQCHFFAGVGVWSYALRQAGWPDDKPVWTGSCPCQPFSAAGNQLGTVDERHLAPVWLNLIRERKPSIIFGEQVAAAIGKHWLDDLFDELENQSYAYGAAVLPACSVGAPNIRERLFWMGYANNKSLQGYGQPEKLILSKRWEVSGRHTLPSNVASHVWASWVPNKGADERVRIIPASYGEASHGNTSVVGRLRAYGNAINAEAAKAFIESYMEAVDA